MAQELVRALGVINKCLHTGNEGTWVMGHIEPAVLFVVLFKGTKKHVVSSMMLYLVCGHIVIKTKSVFLPHM